MRTHARVVIVGAGITGCSAAYHLAHMGWKDIVVVDRGPLFETGGSTNLVPGLIFQTHHSKLMTDWARYTVHLLKSLNDEGEPCLHPVGGVEIACTVERWAELKRKLDVAMSYGLDACLLTPREVKAKIPILNERVIYGGYYVPGDAAAHGRRSAAALAASAMARGVEFRGNLAALEIQVQNGRVRRVLTPEGAIECEDVLLCAGVWAAALARKAGARFPLVGVEYQYVITEPLAVLAEDRERPVTHPILRHHDFGLNFRQLYDSYVIGGFCHRSLIFADEPQLGPDDAPVALEGWSARRRAAEELLPVLKGKTYVQRSRGFIAYCSDLFPIIGQSEVQGLWAALGVWLTHAGGVGKSIAELMTHGESEWDLREADINRFHPHDYTRAYMRARLDRHYQDAYNIAHPLRQIESPRHVRQAPFYARLVAQGAVFFNNAGWEIPQWYEANAPLLKEYDAHIPHRKGWAARYWSRIQGAEHLAVRDRAGLVNLSAFTQIEVSGPAALSFLESICTNQIDRPVGSIVHTVLCNNRGGVMADLMVSRVEPDRFWILTGAEMGPLAFAWIRRHAPMQGTVAIRNMGGQYTAMGLWGPRARDILQPLVEEDISNEAFPLHRIRALYIECVPAILLRLSYVGELGWEIYAPSEYGLRLWDLLWEAGRPYGLVACGAGAFDSLRLEKGRRLWGQDVHSECTPYEAGLERTVRLDKGYFLGRDALLKVKDGVQRRLSCMTFDEADAVALGGEPILGDGRVVGYATSANYGYSVGKSIVYGYLPHEYATPGAKVEIQYFGCRHPATVAAEPLFDPKNERMRL
ncbi:MAG: FAD-dependent oxidoreductase [Caldilinea sp.]|nr:FAD-dependent oxidoreductase [Caldilinea sp.]MDW8442159.1 FAD-dependent oxidoreductase [Caldilineaceae bacterium]